MSFFSQMARLERKAERWPRRCLIFAVVLSAGCFGPWLVIHFSHLWQREHYQFFPMMLLAVAGLTYGCWKNAQQQGLSFETLKLSTPLFVLAVLTFSAALWLNSPWLAFLTMITVLWAVLRNIPFGVSSAAPLLVLLPLPFAMDGELVHGLQRISSRGASALLDLVSIQHLMSGNVLEVSDKNFFVEEACSGIGSVYLLVASAAVYASWRQLRLLVTIPLLLSAVFWAVAGNTFRIFAVAWAHEKLQLDLSSGTLHDTLGSATYLTSLLLLIMTEQVLLFLFEPVGVDPTSRASDTKTRILATAVGRFWDQRTLIDPEIRIRNFFTHGVSGFRVTRGLFIVILMMLFSLGCAGNLWRFWPKLQVSSRAALARFVSAGADSSKTIENAPTSVVAPMLQLNPAILSPISGLAYVSESPASGTMENPADATETEPALDRRSATQRLEWDLRFAETPVMLIITGPCRMNEATVLAQRDPDRSGTDSWAVTETTSAPIPDIANDLPLVLEQTLKKGPIEFRHELTAEFTQTGSPMPMYESGSISGIRQQLSERIGSVSSVREDWYWRVTLRFESDRPVVPSVRPSRVTLFGDILRILREHWRRSE